MEEKKIWYLCDGEKLDCKRIHCYKNTQDNPCRYTKDINHALNFREKKNGSHVSYWESCRDKVGDAAEKSTG